jgi:hypothetical protein
VKKRYILVGLLIAALLAPVGYIEIGCRAGSQMAGAPFKSLLSEPRDHRPEARTFLTYPEWHIVYSADSLARHLAHSPPSAYPYFTDVGSFWSSYCALNRVADPKAAGDAKVMLYTIGTSFSIEMLVKAAYENTVGRLFEWIGGHDSGPDRYARRVQQSYGTFMHETPWYKFPFGSAFSNLWHTGGGGVRSWERHFALSLEYGVKTGYAKLIGWASGTALGADERTMRIVLDADPSKVTKIDARLKPLGGMSYEIPRYAQFTQIAGELAAAGVNFREIAGNDDIFLTVMAPEGWAPVQPVLLSMPLPDQPGRQRLGFSVKVQTLAETLRSLAPGATLEHIYDY